MPSSIKINDIRIDGGTQSRTKLNERHLSHLREVLDDEGRLEPVEVIYDGVDYWLWDGFHRVETYRRAKRSSIPAHITQGTQRDAILKSCGANGKHGLPRCNADKRRAVTRLLADDEWGKWPDSQLARAAGVSREYVVRLRADLVANGELSCDRSQDKQVARGSATYTMDATNIGKTETVAPPLIPTERAILQPVPAPKPAEPPKHWMDTLIIGKHYPVDRKRGVIINEPFDSDQECRAAYPGLRPEMTAHLRINKTFFCMYRFIEPEQPTPLTTSDTPANAAPPTVKENLTVEGRTLHAAGVDDSTSPDEPLQPRHDPRVVSNAGEWTPGDKAYLNRAQAAINHAHPGKMPYVGMPDAARARLVLETKAEQLETQNAWLLKRIAELEAENETLRSENTRLKAEIVVLRQQEGVAA